MAQKENVNVFTREQKEALVDLLAYKGKLTRQEYKTFKGQIYSGNVQGFRKGLEKVIARKENGNGRTD